MDARMTAAFDGLELERQTYLNLDEAAWYCGFRPGKYTKPEKAFHSWISRVGMPRRYAGGRSLRFERRHLDAALRGDYAALRDGFEAAS